MRTDIAIDKLCDIAPYVADIVDKMGEDEELKTSLIKLQKASKKSDYLRYFPKVIKKCDSEVYNILAIMYSKSVEEVKAQNFMTETIPQILELYKNEAFRTFFTSSTASGEQTEAAEELSVGLDNITQKPLI